MWNETKWIGISAQQIEAEKIYAGDLNGRFAYFRRTVVCDKQPGRCLVDITANTRYRLWINGKPVLSGPCKGDWHSHYYETVDVTDYLQRGENVFAVQVLFLNPYDVGEQYGNERTPVLSAVSSPVGHRLAVSGKICDLEGVPVAELATGTAEWQVYLDSSYYMKCKEINCNSGGFCEDVDFRKEPVGWKETGYVCRVAEPGADYAGQVAGTEADYAGRMEGTEAGNVCRLAGAEEGNVCRMAGAEEGYAGRVAEPGADYAGRKTESAGYWWDAVAYETVLPGSFNRTVGFTGKFQVRERPIPLLFEEEGVLDEELGTEVFGKGEGCREEITVKAGRKVRMVFCRDTVINAYMRYSFSGGLGGKVSFTYFEKYVKSGEDIARDDYENGTIRGMSEEIFLSGETLTFEPFWVRTFRFVEIVVEAGEEPICFARPHFRRTGYPMEQISCIRGEEPWVGRLWKMCVDTLQNCMMETYMDCPFYEQMQFLMDTRLQALFHYAVDGDTRLAEKALWDFHCSMTPEGLMHGKYPSSFPQIISTFSLYFVFMLRDYYWQTGDLAKVKRYRSDVDAILEHYDRLIGNSGLVEKIGYWPFVDWQKAWADHAGVPAAAAQGASVIHNLMYAYALQSAAELAGATGRRGLEQEYLDRQQAVCSRVRELCWDQERGMYREGPGIVQFTQHAQSWACLNGMGDGEERSEMLLHALRDQDVIPCSFSTSYELFRALEQENLYGETRGLMEQWIGLFHKNCTTCPEEPDQGRSENHAWSALPMYEMMRKLAGVEPGEPGWKTVRVKPHLEYLTQLQGRAATPQGAVEFRYTPAGGENGICCMVKLPRGLNGVFCLPDGSACRLTEGQNEVIYKP